MMEDFLCIVPARGGSKGLPGKNIKSLVGKPLITWTIEEAHKSKFLKEVYVSTEDQSIAKISEQSGAHVIRRPAELAYDDTSSVDVVLHAIEVLKSVMPKHTILLQCTSPLRLVRDIDQAITYYLEHIGQYDSLIAVTEQPKHPFLSRTLDEQGILQDFIDYDNLKYYRRQDYPKVYAPNGAIYIIKTSTFLEQKSFQTNRTYGYIMDKISSIDIDDIFDFKIAEFLLEGGLNRQ